MQSVFPTRLDTDRSVQSYRKKMIAKIKSDLDVLEFTSSTYCFIFNRECYHGRNKLVCTATCARGNELLK